MVVSGRMWMACAAMVAIGLTTIDAAPARWIAARQALPGDLKTDMLGDRVSVSGDGRFVAFVSRAGLLPADTNDVKDIYVLDLETSALTLESAPPGGAVSRSDSVEPSLSGDGRFLVFQSMGMRLADDAPDEAPVPGLYLRDRLQHRTTRVSVDRTGRPFQAFRCGGTISADGRFIALNARGDPFGVGGGFAERMTVYRLDRESGAVVPVSVAVGDRPMAIADAYDPSISADGNIIAFIANGPLDPNRPWRSQIPAPFQRSHVYVRDVAAGTTTCLGCDLKDATPYTRTQSPSVSADGRYVAFVADEIRTIAKQVAFMAKIWLYDRASSVTTLVTQSPRGHAPNGTSRHPVVSAHGEIVVFESNASNLLCDRRCARDARDENLLPDIFLFDRVNGTIRGISRDGEDQWWDPSVGPSIDHTGRVIAFSSRHPVGTGDIDSEFNLLVWRDDAPSPTH
jgi:Tol biopolymer transport system component